MKLRLGAALIGTFALCGVVSPAYSDNFVGFLYSGGVYTPIAPPGSTSAAALGINASGQVVGQYTSGASDYGFDEVLGLLEKGLGCTVA
jgi:hypothetical protein